MRSTEVDQTRAFDAALAGALACTKPVHIPDLAPWQWTVGIIAAVLVGIAKTGVPGFGILAVPLMVLAVGDARQSPGWLLPLLCAADLYAVAAYRRHAYARRLFTLFPWVACGMAAGAIALGARERIMRLLIATIVLAMLAVRWLRVRSESRRSAAASGSEPAARLPESWRQPAVYGVVAGFATMIANAAGPVMNLYLLAKRLPKEEFVGTGAWFFLIVNLCKLPVYAGRGLVGARSLTFDALLLPAVLSGAFLGRLLMRRLSQRFFERMVLVLTAAAAGLLFVPK